MYFELSSEIESAKELASKFAGKRLLPLVEEDYGKQIPRREIIEEMGELGFFGCLIPEKYGGTNSGYLSAVVMAEEIARVDASYAGHFISQLAGPPVTILKFGDEEQKEKYIPGIISGKRIVLFAATEPDAGSDVVSMKGTAVEKGDQYILNGVKTWITNAPDADIGLVWFYTDKEKKHHGISCFIIDIKDTSGVSAKKIQKFGLGCSDVGELAFEDVEIAKYNLLGKPGEGFKILMETLGSTRLLAAARALGVARACLEESLKYAKERIQFGKPIVEFQMIQSQLADMYVEHEASRLLVYQAAANKDRGIDDITEVATAKYFACEAGVKAANTAMKILSAYGLSVEYPLHRYVSDAQALPITEGTSNIQKLIIMRKLMKEKTF